MVDRITCISNGRQNHVYKQWLTIKFVFFSFQVEYMLVKFDHKSKTAKLSLKALPVLEELQKAEKEQPK